MSTLDHAFFYNSIDKDRVYDAESFEHWLKKFFTSGIFAGDCQVIAGTGMTVSMASGYANVDGKVRFFENAQILQVATANATYDRIDTVVIERNDTDRDVTAKIVTGNYSSDPVAPEPVRENGVYQLVVAQIYVTAGATKILQEDITDTRTDTAVCGVVTGAVNQYDFDQFKAQFDEWFAAFKGRLGDDPATNLQNQIDELSTALGGYKFQLVAAPLEQPSNDTIYLIKEEE